MTFIDHLFYILELSCTPVTSSFSISAGSILCEAFGGVGGLSIINWKLPRLSEALRGISIKGLIKSGLSNVSEYFSSEQFWIAPLLLLLSSNVVEHISSVRLNISSWKETRLFFLSKRLVDKCEEELFEDKELTPCSEALRRPVSVIFSRSTLILIKFCSSDLFFSPTVADGGSHPSYPYWVPSCITFYLYVSHNTSLIVQICAMIN